MTTASVEPLMAGERRILLTSPEALVVERDLYRLKAPVLGMSAAIPLR